LDVTRPPVAPQPSHAHLSHRSVLDRSMNILGLMKHLLRRDESTNMPKNIFPGRGTPRVVERKPDRSVNIFRVTRVGREVKSKGGWTPVPAGDRVRDRKLGSS
jgi:hypothetical protein